MCALAFSSSCRTSAGSSSRMSSRRAALREPEVEPFSTTSRLRPAGEGHQQRAEYFSPARARGRHRQHLHPGLSSRDTRRSSATTSARQRQPHYDDNGVLVRPAPIGNVQPHRIDADYFGWTGDGHIGRTNVTHAFYQVLGHDSSTRSRPATGINAQLAAVEFSQDHDWLRFAHRSFCLGR
jgi:hypothetical protein